MKVEAGILCLRGAGLEGTVVEAPTAATGEVFFILTTARGINGATGGSGRLVLNGYPILSVAALSGIGTGVVMVNEWLEGQVVGFNGTLCLIGVGKTVHKVRIAGTLDPVTDGVGLSSVGGRPHGAACWY